MRHDLVRSVAPPAALFLLNFLICRELFGIEYLKYLGSIEAAYVGLSRYILENWRDLNWFPLWYAGIPYQNTYPPLLHLLVAAFAALTGASPALAHHFVTATFYCAGSVTLYWLARRLGADRRAAFVAGLFYSLASPSAWLIPAVAADMGSPWAARRLHALVYYGEGPHVSSMTLLAAAVALFGLALEKKRAGWYVAAACGLASVVLTNWLGGAALAAAVLSWLLAAGEDRKGWLRAAALGLYAYALASPWIPPSTLATVFRNAQWVHGRYAMGAAQAFSWAVVLIALLIVHTLLRRAGASRLVHFASLFTLLAGTMTLAAHWAGWNLLPQPERYHLEMEAGLALLVGALAGRVLGAARRAAALTLILAILGVWQFGNYRAFARRLIQPVEMTSTIEYRMARWFGEHLGERRVMAPGSISFWMTAFTDTPQLGGGFEQGVTSELIPHVVFQIFSGMNAGPREGEIAVLWLKAFGVHAVAVGGPHSREFYKPYRNPQKFAGLLPELWREGDDVVYAVPQRSDSLARVVRRKDLVEQRPPSAVDVDALVPFVAALDDTSLPLTEWRWRSRKQAVVIGELHREHVLSVAISFHPGWRGRVNGRPAKLRADGLSLMVVEPECEGRCQVELEFTGGVEAMLARWASLLAAAIGLAAIAVEGRRTAR
jgi:hypothetical protein